MKASSTLRSTASSYTLAPELRLPAHCKDLNRVTGGRMLRRSKPQALPPLSASEAVEALAKRVAEIRLIDTRTGRWLELNADDSLPVLAEKIKTGMSKKEASGLSKLSIGPESKSRRVLNSWKEIAAYTGRGVRTVQRYEAVLGLPIRRTDERDRCAVLAFTDELDAWLEARPMRGPRVAEAGLLRAPKQQLSMTA
jgi:hypothetical protein